MVMRVEIHKQRRNRLQVTVRLRFSSGMLAVTPEAKLYENSGGPVLAIRPNVFSSMAFWRRPRLSAARHVSEHGLTVLEWPAAVRRRALPGCYVRPSYKCTPRAPKVRRARASARGHRVRRAIARILTGQHRFASTRGPH